MRGLLIKDFMLMKNQGKSLIVMLVMAVAVNLWLDRKSVV